MRHILSFVLVLAAALGTTILAPAPSLAQQQPISLSVPRSSLDGSSPRLDVTAMQPAPLDRELWKAGRRARFVIAAGVGVTASAAAHVGWAYPIRECGYGHIMKNSLYGAGVLGAAGITVLLAGVTKLLLTRPRYRATGAHAGIATAIAAGAAAATQAVLVFAWGLDQPGCST